MKKRAISIIKIIAVLALLLLFSACAASSADKLFRLPQSSDEYLQLEAIIEEELSAGAVYSPPTSGEYRQSVQLEDLDGDGRDEAVVFLKYGSETKPLRIYIYRQENESFVKAATLDGEGTAIESISYVDMNGDGSDEIVVGRQISSGMKILTIYSSRRFRMEMLMSTNYTGYTVCDLSEAQGNDIFVIRETNSESGRDAEIYSYLANGEIATATVKISAGVSKIARLRTTALSDGNNAVLVEGVLSDNTYFTDVFTMQGDKAVNVTLNAATGVSDGTLRAYEVYSRDIDGDGKLEIPHPILIQPQNGMASFRIIEWYSYDAKGKANRESVTYSNNTDGWIISLHDNWREKLSYVRTNNSSGEKSTIFGFKKDDGENAELFSVIVISGENRTERAERFGRFILRDDGDRVFAARIYDERGASALGITRESVVKSFELLYSEWKTGVI